MKYEQAIFSRYTNLFIILCSHSLISCPLSCTAMSERYPFFRTCPFQLLKLLQCSFRICLLKYFKIFQLLSNTFTPQNSMIPVTCKLYVHTHICIHTHPIHLPFTYLFHLTKTVNTDKYMMNHLKSTYSDIQLNSI